MQCCRLRCRSLSIAARSRRNSGRCRNRVRRCRNCTWPPPALRQAVAGEKDMAAFQPPIGLAIKMVAKGRANRAYRRRAIRAAAVGLAVSDRGSSSVMAKADSLASSQGQSSDGSADRRRRHHGALGRPSMPSAAGIRTRCSPSARRLGAGASGGLLGALMPHMPDRWNAKKQFQFDALVSLEAEIAALEAATGLSAGYSRSGRLMPLAEAASAQDRARPLRRRRNHWQSGDRRFHWHVAGQAAGRRLDRCAPPARAASCTTRSPPASRPVR